jgi:hypothetical protein
VASGKHAKVSPAASQPTQSQTARLNGAPTIDFPPRLVLSFISEIATQKAYILSYTIVNGFGWPISRMVSVNVFPSGETSNFV